MASIFGSFGVGSLQNLKSFTVRGGRTIHFAFTDVKKVQAIAQSPQGAFQAIGPECLSKEVRAIKEEGQFWGFFERAYVHIRLDGEAVGSVEVQQKLNGGASPELSPFESYESKEVGRIRFYSYLLPDSEETTVTQAANAIQSYLRSNKTSVALFRAESLEEIKEEIFEGKIYLTINNDAVCLSRMLAPTSATKELRDACFSGAMLEEPVLCLSERHNLEKEHARFWMAKKGNVCPGDGQPHGIVANVGDELQTNDHVKVEIDRFYENHQDVIDREKTYQNKVKEKDDEIALLKKGKEVDQKNLKGKDAEIDLLKKGKKAEHAAHFAKFVAEKKFEKLNPKLDRVFRIIRMTPVVGLFFGITRGIILAVSAKKHSKDGNPAAAKEAREVSKAEVIAGAIAMVPFLGTWASALISKKVISTASSFVAVSDIKKASEHENSEMKLEEAYRFCFPNGKPSDLTKEKLDEAISVATSENHDDPYHATWLNTHKKAKSLIYADKGWK